MLQFDNEAAPLLGAVYKCQGDILTEEVAEWKDKVTGICSLTDVFINTELTKLNTINSNNIIKLHTTPQRLVVDNPNGKNKFYFAEDFEAAKWCGAKDGDIIVISSNNNYKRVDGQLHLLVTDAELDDSLCNIEWHEEEMERAYDEGKTDGYHEGYEEALETIKRDKKNGFVEDDESFIETLEREADDGTLELHRRGILSWTNKKTGKSVIGILENDCKNPHTVYFVPEERHYALFDGGYGILKSELSINDVVINNDGTPQYWIPGTNGGPAWLCSIPHEKDGSVVH